MFRKFLVLVAACSAFIAFRWQAQDNFHLSNDISNKDQLLMEVVLQSLKYNHYSPETIDDEFSQKVYDLYLKRLDLNKRFFLKEDINKFVKYRNQLDNAALEGNFDFFDLVSTTFKERFEEVKTFYKEILDQPFDFEKNESFETEGKKLDFVSKSSELRERWRKYLKLQVLSRVQTKLEHQEKAKERGDEDFEIKTFEAIEKAERERLLKNYNNWARNIDKDTRNDRIAVYINTFANAHEPHSGYFPPLEKQNFNIRMSGKLEGIGAQLREEEGYIKVVNVVPGSASWRQGELEVNDKIIKVAQADEEPVDVVDMRINDVLPMIRGKKGTEVRLTVKKTSGETKVIPIIRDVVVLEESYAKSAIIEHKKTKSKVGLIDLRSFYADFNDPNGGRRCSKDVQKEVEKLIAEKVDGIVIDLRFNGGGSLSDVVSMSGLFIDKGPIVQVKSRNSRPYVLEDQEKGVLYNGPLVIMVNAYSASASEIMAAALQDYGRAVIVGTSPTTFGKGTVQRFYPLDAMVPERFKKFGELGSIKITIQKFYRIDGGATQLRGVTPDIVLPGPYSFMTIGEKDEDYPMEWNAIDKASYRKTNAIKNLDKVKRKSAKRVAKNKTFKLLKENAAWIKARQEDTKYPLQLEEYTNYQKKLDEEAEKYSEMTPEMKDMAISSLTADLEGLASDSTRAKSIDNWHKGLKKDAYLNEVLYIIRDIK